MKITYLINQYPKVSHSFIRREILALEKQGFEVQRIAQRGWSDTLVDPQDLSEREKTQYIVKQGALSFAFAAIKVMLNSPKLFFSTLFLAIGMAKGSDRSLAHHFIYFIESVYFFNNRFFCAINFSNIKIEKSVASKLYKY